MKTKRDRLVFLHHLTVTTRSMLRNIENYDSTLSCVFSMKQLELVNILRIPHQRAKQLYQAIHTPNLYLQMKKNLQHIETITKYDSFYPKELQLIPDQPYVLYGMGNKHLLQATKKLSVIGTRKPSNEAYAKVAHIVSPLIDEKWVIVSGLAYGVDSMAHQRTLERNGHTIAVLGGGFQHVYPRSNMELFNRIVKKGLVISEYPPYQRPQKYHFPERNRIISGLSKGTLVIEATQRSGTLITVDQALEQGREVYAVPGSPVLTQTKGCHEMIQDGAKLVTNAEDIMEDWM